VRFGSSRIWEHNKTYYDDTGVEAWTRVPFYATSNPAIAETYANLVVRFVQDCMRTGRHDRTEPFYVVEVGAGAGAFAFYFLARLCAIAAHLGLPSGTIVYVMTDGAQRNVDHWHAQPAFAAYVEAGALELARFDAENDVELVLPRSGRTLGADPSHRPRNPMVAIANYVFDTLPHDVFRVRGDTRQLGYVSVSADGAANGATPFPLSSARFAYTYEPMTEPPYANAVFTNVFEACASRLNDHYLLFPIGALGCVDRLIDIAGSGLFLIASDKGFSDAGDIYQRAEPDVTFHDEALSVLVNFEAIGRFVEARGGAVLHQMMDLPLQTSLFVAGLPIDALRETTLAADTFVHARSHALLYAFSHTEAVQPSLTLEWIVPLLAASRWDAALFHAYAGTIAAEVRAGRARTTDLRTLVDAVPHIAANVYVIPGAADVFYDLGMLLQDLHDYPGALAQYERSIAAFGATDTTLYNMGLCRYFAGDRDGALCALREAVERNPGYVMARGWIAQIEERPGTR
jgi:tetratricopeptide (TPR) repeat protein